MTHMLILTHEYVWLNAQLTLSFSLMTAGMYALHLALALCTRTSRIVHVSHHAQTQQRRYT